MREEYRFTVKLSNVHWGDLNPVPHSHDLAQDPHRRGLDLARLAECTKGRATSRLRHL